MPKHLEIYIVAACLHVAESLFAIPDLGIEQSKPKMSGGRIASIIFAVCLLVVSTHSNERMMCDDIS